MQGLKLRNFSVFFFPADSDPCIARHSQNYKHSLQAATLKAGKANAKEMEKKAREMGEKLGADAKAASGKTFVAVVDGGAGSDDAKCCGFAMETALKVLGQFALFRWS